MGKRDIVTRLPQSDIDLMFWQYVQGVKDVVITISPSNNERQTEVINVFINEKLKYIQENHGKTPSFTLRAEVIMGKIEIKKKLI
jgi:hypothetical protein